MHTAKVEKNTPINFDCPIKKERDFNRSWNKWSNKYCSRCNRTTLGITRGFCWYCSHCNSYLINFLNDQKSIAYKTNDTFTFLKKFIQIIFFFIDVITDYHSFLRKSPIEKYIP